MDYKEIALILVGIAVAIFCLNLLNEAFATEIPFFAYVGSAGALGIFVIVGGFFFLKIIEGHLDFA